MNQDENCETIFENDGSKKQKKERKRKKEEKKSRSGRKEEEKKNNEGWQGSKKKRDGRRKERQGLKEKGEGQEGERQEEEETGRGRGPCQKLENDVPTAKSSGRRVDRSPFLVPSRKKESRMIKIEKTMAKLLDRVKKIERSQRKKKKFCPNLPPRKAGLKIDISKKRKKPTRFRKSLAKVPPTIITAEASTPSSSSPVPTTTTTTTTKATATENVASFSAGHFHVEILKEADA